MPPVGFEPTISAGEGPLGPASEQFPWSKLRVGLLANFCFGEYSGAAKGFQHCILVNEVIFVALTESFHGWGAIYRPTPPFQLSKHFTIFLKIDLSSVPLGRSPSSCSFNFDLSRRVVLLSLINEIYKFII
jgi:hypothetical protein